MSEKRERDGEPERGGGAKLTEKQSSEQTERTTAPAPAEVAYPPELAAAEAKLLERLRAWRSPGGKQVASDAGPQVGFGLSGGGIRSATFCLGVFQSLARHGLLRKIDVLSTVSGGGYFGTFFGRLFNRSLVSRPEDVEEILALPGEGPPPSCDDSDRKVRQSIFPWLRENGRYLSPQGSGDLLLGGAVLFRNWVAVQVVLLTLTLLVFLLAQAVRYGAEAALTAMNAAPEWVTLQVWPLPGAVLWGSPYIFLPALLLVIWALPLGWAYWLVRSTKPNVLSLEIHPVVGLTLVMVLAVVAALWRSDDTRVLVACGALLAAAVLTLLAWWRSSHLARREREGQGLTSRSAQAKIFEYNFARHWLSARLKTALVLTVVTLAFALVDALGQTAYVLIVDPSSTLGAWLAGLLAGLTGLAAFARRIVVSFGGRKGDSRPGVGLKVVASVGAAIIVVVLLTTVDSLSHGVAWTFDRPEKVPEVMRPPTSLLRDAESWKVSGEPNDWVVKPQWLEAGDGKPGDGGAAGITAEGAPGGEEGNSGDDAVRQTRSYKALGLAVLVTGLFSFLFSRSWPFLNRSSHLPLYAARLTRAYLGASNPRRHEKGTVSVTEVLPGDDAGMESYWSRLEAETRPEAGSPPGGVAPLHLINVTINETIDGRSQVQQQDRKGTGMAVGPAGLSVGVRHHAVFDPSRPDEERYKVATLYPRSPSGGEPAPYRVFDYPDGRFTGERLPVGQWVGISGAAFSTGVGYRTSLGLSLLTGFGNVRLGYWWDSGVERHRRHGGLAAWLRRMLPVQSFLLDEFLARFPGTARRYWYLSDGGHFENLGGYELIRRRLPLIVLLDAEQDGGYTFTGLANLVRKARLDFGAEIELLDEDELRSVVPEDLQDRFGTLEMLRRGRWKEELQPDLKESERTYRDIDPPDERCFSRAYATLARVRYDGEEEPRSWILYIKPTLMGDEPRDVLQYHSRNPDFPHETTADQFFDEAQWESYRRLGDHIASQLFQRPAKDDGKAFVPWRLEPPAGKASGHRPPTKSRGTATGGRGKTAAGSRGTAKRPAKKE